MTLEVMPTESVHCCCAYQKHIIYEPIESSPMPTESTRLSEPTESSVFAPNESVSHHHCY